MPRLDDTKLLYFNSLISPKRGLICCCPIDSHYPVSGDAPVITALGWDDVTRAKTTVDFPGDPALLEFRSARSAFRSSTRTVPHTFEVE